MRLSYDLTREEHPTNRAADLWAPVRDAWEYARAHWTHPQGIRPVLTETFRSAARQAADYAQGRTAPGHIVTNAKPGQSLHNWFPAVAFDVGFERADGSMVWDDGHFLELARQLRALLPGLEWGAHVSLGGDWHSFSDLPHFQVRGFRWEDAAAGRMPAAPSIPSAGAASQGATGNGERNGARGDAELVGAAAGGGQLHTQRVVSAADDRGSGGAAGQRAEPVGAGGGASGGTSGAVASSPAIRPAGIGSDPAGGTPGRDGAAIERKGPVAPRSGTGQGEGAPLPLGAMWAALWSLAVEVAQQSARQGWQSGESMRALLKGWFLSAAPRLVGAGVGYLAAKASAAAGITVSPEAQAAAVAAGYGIVHTLADHLFGTNPQ